MEKVICPKCARSEKVRQTGTWNEGGDMKNDGTYSSPKIQEYRCSDCDLGFVAGSDEIGF